MADKKWPTRFFRIAKEYSTWSKDPSSQVGCVAVDSNRVETSHGYNGFPRGIEDLDIRLNNRELKYQYVVHAEINMVANATRLGRSLIQTSVYVWGLPPCPECVKLLIQCGIREIHLPHEIFIDSGEWVERWNFSYDLLKEAGIEVYVHGP